MHCSVKRSSLDWSEITLLSGTSSGSNPYDTSPQPQAVPSAVMARVTRKSRQRAPNAEPRTYARSYRYSVGACVASSTSLSLVLG